LRNLIFQDLANGERHNRLASAKEGPDLCDGIMRVVEGHAKPFYAMLSHDPQGSLRRR
jgi:hypothetical protein